MSRRHGDIRRSRGRQSRVTGILTDLLAAFTLLTRVPLGRLVRSGTSPDLPRCVWAFPVVGVVVNGLGGLVYWLAQCFDMPPLLAAVWALAATMIVTGGLHDDGLADTADGFGGGATPERKLEIMRDSHIGCYGALALLLSVVMRVAAISGLEDPSRVMVAFCSAGMLGRGGILMLLLQVSPARDDGMGAAMGKTPAGRAVMGLTMALAVCLLALPLKLAAVALVFACGAALAVAKLAQSQIGGYTGDVLGAGEVVTECVVLTIAASGIGIT
jgi:adenosylcobinamide-GDP ribazoletransferase